jgi:hypothetical protein
MVNRGVGELRKIPALEPILDLFRTLIGRLMGLLSSTPAGNRSRDQDPARGWARVALTLPLARGILLCLQLCVNERSHSESAGIVQVFSGIKPVGPNRLGIPHRLPEIGSG